MLSVQYKLAFLTQNQMMIVCVDLAAVGFILTVEFNICFVLRLSSIHCPLHLWFPWMLPSLMLITMSLCILSGIDVFVCCFEFQGLHLWRLVSWMYTSSSVYVSAFVLSRMFSSTFTKSRELLSLNLDSLTTLNSSSLLWGSHRPFQQVGHIQHKQAKKVWVPDS
jgi:hypothetical protein